MKGRRGGTSFTEQGFIPCSWCGSEIKRVFIRKDAVCFDCKKEKKRMRSFLSNNKITEAQWNKIKELYGNKCLSCGLSGDIVKMTIDHVVPKSRGGDNSTSNLQLLCELCNWKKYTKSTDYRAGKVLE